MYGVNSILGYREWINYDFRCSYYLFYHHTGSFRGSFQNVLTSFHEFDVRPQILIRGKTLTDISFDRRSNRISDFGSRNTDFFFVRAMHNNALVTFLMYYLNILSHPTVPGGVRFSTVSNDRQTYNIRLSSGTPVNDAYKQFYFSINTLPFQSSFNADNRFSTFEPVETPINVRIGDRAFNDITTIYGIMGPPVFVSEHYPRFNPRTGQRVNP